MSQKLQIQEAQFVNEVRLNAAQWLIVLSLAVAVISAAPGLWTKLERFEAGPDYRLPYQLSKDYWLYARRLGQLRSPDPVIVLGDSVIWGEYVLPDGTLPHFLSRQAGQAGLYANAGVNGLFPLALEGLVREYGRAIRHRKVLLHCNLLWLSSPKADLQTEKEEKFNHAELVPQFWPRIPCYKADVSDRLEIVVERKFKFMAWVQHLQNAYFDQKNILAWTLAEDGNDPPHYPNTYKNPLAQITFQLPMASQDDSQRGPKSPRHKAWFSGGAGVTRFDWVDLESSRQWRAFQRLTKILRSRGNDVFVVLGPFNEHLLAEDNRPAFGKLRDDIVDWLEQNQIPHLAPEALPSEFYADASHPVTAGYDLLAQHISESPAFQQWRPSR